MSPVIEQEATTITAPRYARNFQAAEIARDLAIMDELENFVQSLPVSSEGRSPTPQEIRAMAYEEREAAL